MIDVLRSQSAPESLAKRILWTGDDVRERLAEDFHGKCYLCEGVLQRGWQVDHLRPRSAFPALTYVWTNLYPACGSCNQRRLQWGARRILVDGEAKPWPVEGMLEPAAGDDIAGRLLQWIVFGVGVGDISVHFEPTMPTDGPAANTAEELRHLHRGHLEDARRLRALIQDRARILLERLVALHCGPEAARPKRVAELRLMLSSKAPYSGVLRPYLRDRLESRADLQAELGL